MVESQSRGAPAQRGRYLFAGAVATLLCAVAGVALNIAGIREWAPTWPALGALILLGLGLIAERARRARLAVALSVPVMLLGGGVLAVALFGLRGTLSPHLGSLLALPSNSAAGLLAAALALALGAHTQRAALQVACTLLAAVAVALGTFGLLGRLFGIAPGIGWASVDSVSVLTGSGLIACGSTLLLQRALGRDGGDPLQRASLLPALFVLALALGATVMAWRVSAESALAAQRQRFEHQAQQLATAIEQRLRGYVDALRGAQGLFAASDGVDAEEWQRYWEQVDLQGRYPAVVGAGYATRVDARERGDFEGAMAVGRRGGFRIWPAGERASYFPVTFLEPAEGANLLLLGYDLASEPARRDALQRAIARDEAALSARIAVAGSTAGDTEAGFAVYAPLHSGGRRDGEPDYRLAGVAYFDVRAAEWIRLVDREPRTGLRVQLYDGDTEDPAQRLYADGDDAAPAALRHAQTLNLAGRQWRLAVEATPAFSAANRSRTPLSVLVVGLLFSLLLFAIAWLLAGLRARAERLAARRTAELQRSQSAFRALTDTANDAIIAAGGDGRIRYVNPAAGRCFGYSIDALLRQPLTQLMPERYRTAHSEGMARLLGGGEPHVIGRTVEVAGLRSDGSEFPLEISIAHWRDDEDEHFTAILRDITRRRETEQALEQQRSELARSNADLEQFAYVASHDLQEPLRMVASYVQLLARRYKGKLDADADDFIGFAVDGALRMQRLIDDLLTYSRIATRPVEARDVAAADCLQVALRNLAARVQETGAEIRVGALPTVRVDPLQLSQLFQNLVANALKFSSDAPPHVTIDAEREQDHWHFRVRDNGIGLDPQYADRIFVIFQRLHTRQQYSGTGIGLAICKKIVERAGGRIWVESRPGDGATFHFTLPVLESDA
ncbi:CHASE domain-containing protein [Tahibacter caeni]|uniref:CHASE domain-containing protein n=1 Tax=Tahibacter caeni TaxID=1453545 RepID=UPI0021474C81|nr:CHASE domain-containing protein [Tahibacter caeni]